MRRFFLIEDTVLSTTESLIERQWIDEVWESAVARIAGVLEVHLVSDQKLKCPHVDAMFPRRELCFITLWAIRVPDCMRIGTPSISGLCLCVLLPSPLHLPLIAG